jgi:hypothetical protein
MKQTLSGLRDFYRFRKAAVLGGGPSLPADFARLPQGCLLVAVNYHALQLCQPHYIVYNDDPGADPRLAQALRSTKAVQVSPHACSDVVFDIPVWTGSYSSNTAAWFALYLGCNPVILCGMDCYQGDRPYFYDFGEDRPHFHYPLDHHLRPWVEDARNLCPNPQRLVAMSGPLTNIFGEYREISET